jgi:acetyl-CoA acetyltransferase
MTTPLRRSGYDGVAVAVPVTIPYRRHSIRSAHWWLARALKELLAASGLRKDDVDGVCVSSFLLVPDTAVGLMQHLGLSPRWLDHIPMGGASGVVALRRAARAVQSGDASVVACLAGDTNHVDSFRLTLGSFSQFARDAVYPYGSGGPNASFAFLTDHYMRNHGAQREDFGKLCIAQRRSAASFPHALLRKPLSLAEYLEARPIAEPLRLFDCVMLASSTCHTRAFSRPSSDTTRSRTTPSKCVAAGRWIETISTRRPVSAPQTSISCRRTTITP